MKPNSEEYNRKINAFLRGLREFYTLDLKYEKPLKVVPIHGINEEEVKEDNSCKIQKATWMKVRSGPLLGGTDRY